MCIVDETTTAARAAPPGPRGAQARAAPRRGRRPARAGGGRGGWTTTGSPVNNLMTINNYLYYNFPTVWDAFVTMSICAS